MDDIDIICTSPCSEYFDQVIGNIEDIILSEEFQNFHEVFLETHWRCFENTEENKLIYTNIFEEYTETFENYFQVELNKRMHVFNMQRFAEELDKSNVFHDIANNGEIFELLYSFTNFQTFKELMLAYRNMKEGNTPNLDVDILITKPLIFTDNAEEIMQNVNEVNINVNEGANAVM